VAVFTMEYGRPSCTIILSSVPLRSTISTK